MSSRFGPESQVREDQKNRYRSGLYETDCDTLSSQDRQAARFARSEFVSQLLVEGRIKEVKMRGRSDGDAEPVKILCQPPPIIENTGPLAWIRRRLGR